MYDESIKPPDASKNSVAPALSYIRTKFQVKVDGSCLKQDKVTFIHKNVVNISKVYEINMWAFTVDKDFMLGNSLLETVNLVKSTTDFNNINILAIGFNPHVHFSLSGGTGFAKNVIIFGI